MFLRSRVVYQNFTTRNGGDRELRLEEKEKMGGGSVLPLCLISALILSSPIAAQPSGPLLLYPALEPDTNLTQGPDLLELAARSLSRIHVEIEEEQQVVVVEEGVNVNLDCRPFQTRNFEVFEGATEWYFVPREITGDEVPDFSLLQYRVNSSDQVQTDERWLNISSTSFSSSPDFDFAHHGDFVCFSCTTPDDECVMAIVTLQLAGAPPILIKGDDGLQVISFFERVRIGSNVCINRNSENLRFALLCDIEPPDLNQGIRTAIPTPLRIWTTEPDNVVIYDALDGDSSPVFNPEFFMDDFRQLLAPGVIPGVPILDIQRISGALLFDGNVTGDLSDSAILPDLPRRDAEFIRNLVFDEILGSYTCIVENEYGIDMATTTVSECSTSDCCDVGAPGFAYRNATGECCNCVSGVRVRFSSASYTVSEDGGVVVLTILRCGSFREDVPLSLTFSQLTATGGVDYGPFPSDPLSLITIIPANTSLHQFGMNIRDDAIVETPETFNVTLQRYLGTFDPFRRTEQEEGVELSGVLSEALVTILDNDFVVVSIEPDEFVAMESAERNLVEFVLTKNGTAVRDVFLTLTVVSNMSREGEDYAVREQEIVFAPEEDEVTVSFEILNDDIVEDVETLQLVLDAAEGETAIRLGGAGGVVNGVILDDDDDVFILFAESAYTVSESEGVVTVRLRKEGTNQRDVAVTVAVDTSATQAIEGADFNLTEFGDPVVVFSPTDVVRNFTFAVRRDGLYEDAEGLSLVLRRASGETAVVLSQDPGQVLILDSDEVSVGFGSAEYTAMESLLSLEVSVELQQGVLDIPLTVEVRVQPRPTDLASEGEDFLLPSTALTFMPGGPQALPMMIELEDDEFFEGREEFTLQLRTNQDRVLLTTETARVAIVDNEDLIVQFNNVTYMIEEPDVPLLLIRITLVSRIERDITLNLVTMDGRATAGNDYTSLNRSLTFTPTSSVADAMVFLQDDAVSEGLEEFFLTIQLTNEMLGLPGEVARATVLIFDDERILISLSNNTYTGFEGESLVSVVLLKSGETQQDTTVIISITDQSATGGQDYGFFPADQLNLTTVILADETELHYPIILRDDRIVEPVERFTVTLYLLEEEEGEGEITNTFLSGTTEAEVFIIDDDAVNITIVPEVLSVSEDEESVSVTIIRTDSFEIDPVLSLIAQAFTAPGTAQGGIDFSAQGEEFAFSDDTPSNYTYIVRILEDEIVEEPEDFSIVLQVPPDLASNFILHNQEVEVQINDNDAVTVSMETTLYEVVESSGKAEVCVTKDAEVSVPLTVILQPSEMTETDPDLFQAIADTDFDSSSLTVTFPGNASRVCADIPILNDGLVGESREVFTVQFTIPPVRMAAFVGLRSSALVIVNDVPDVTFGFAREETRVREFAGSASVCLVVFNPGPNQQLNTTVSVIISILPLTADASDYEAPDLVTLLLTNTARERCIQLTIADNDDFENTPETLRLTISNFSLADPDLVGFASRPNSTLLILDDDRDAVVGFEAGSMVVNVSEGAGDVMLCVGVLFPPPELRFESVIAVGVGTRRDTADSFDYVQLSVVNQDLTLMLSASERRACFQVQIIDDAIFEGSSPETFEVVLSILARQESDDLQRVTADPMSAIVRIIDDDPALAVGFEDTFLRVNESEGSVSLCVSVLGGGEIEFPFSVDVLLESENSTADIRRDFDLASPLVLMFNNTLRSQCFEVALLDDDSFETAVPETILLRLQVTAADSQGIMLAAGASRARIEVVDDDALPTTAMPTTAMPTTTQSPTTMSPTTMFPDSATTSPTPPLQPENNATLLGNDTVVGDPLFSVPLLFSTNSLNLLPPEARPRFPGDSSRLPHLCYQIHGEPSRVFNLVSDSCTSVNALYTSAVPPSEFSAGVNVIRTIGISATDSFNRYVYIEVGIDNSCVPLIRRSNFGSPNPVEMIRFDEGGVSVAKRRNRVRVSVPNCDNQRLVMYVSCENQTAGIPTPMIRFDITRGVNLSPTSHGLIGQFWNVPINIQSYDYNGPTPTYLDVENLFAVCVSPPERNGVSVNPRKFVAEFFSQKWDATSDSCFYSGNIQGGRLLEVSDPRFNDPVIEGYYTDYITGGLFQNSFMYSQFSANCSLP